CDQPAAVGDCADYKLLWNFNATAGRCQQFYYGGCGGNDNRFETETDCAAHCLPNIDNRLHNEPQPQ
ncbi:CG34276, partial [Drosophila busckii]